MVQRNPAPGELEPIERASRDELQALQLQRLQSTLMHAYENVPHYRAAFDAAGVHPADLKTLADLARFPFTEKKALRDNYPFGLFAVPREQVVRVHASSGTTGKPTVVGYTQNDIDTWATVVARSIRAAGGRRGDLVHISYGYGLSEVMGPGVASECIESKDGPVIWEDHFYPEIIDPDTGEVLPDGEEGELVFTSLTKEALPIIRYRTRDLTRLLPPTSRAMRRMGRITGRSDDMLIIRGVNVFPSQIEELVLKMPALAPQYQLVVARDGHLDTLEVLCELRDAVLAPDAVAALARELQHCIKTHVGVTTHVTLMPPHGIERTLTGKARRVVDRRPKQ